MNRLLAAALCSSAMIVAGPAVYAQSTMGTTGASGDPYATTPPPLSSSPMETSEGSISNPPPLDRSGNPRHVSDKDNSSGTGDGGDMSGLTGLDGSGEDGADAGGDGDGEAAGGDVAGQEGGSMGVQ